MFRKKHKKRAKRNALALLALSLVAVIGIGSGLAYLTDYDASTNKFTMGDTDIELEEPNWKNPVKAVTEINGNTAGKPNRNGDEVVVGDVLTYSITAYNSDETESWGMTITDTVEEGLTVDEASISHGGTYDAASRTITWEIPPVLPLTDMVVYFKAAVNEKAAEPQGTGKVENDAWAKVGEGKDARQSNTVSNPLTKDPQTPVKSISRDSEAGVGGSNVTVGDQITYELLVYNNNDDVATVTVTDTLDPKVSFVSASDGGTEAAGVVTWTLTDMPAHSSKLLTLTVEVAAVYNGEGKLEPITNQFATDDINNQYDSNPVENPTRDPSTPKQPEKTYDPSTAAGAGGAKVNVGDEITYKIKYYNHEAEAVQVVITDVLEGGLDYVENSATNGGVYDADTKTVTWTLTVPAHTGGSVTFQAKVNANAVVKVANQANVQVGSNPSINTNKVVNWTEDTTNPGDTVIKDPSATLTEGEAYLRMKVEFLDENGNHLTDQTRIEKIMDTIYYDTSYVYQGTVADPSILTSNIVHGQSYSTADLQDMIDSKVVYKEYNQILFDYDTTRAGNMAVRYYNYTANNGIFGNGASATLFTNIVVPSDWDGSDFEILGAGYRIKVTVQVAQIAGMTQEEAYEALDTAAP
jgi:fimbrial isopeptide formation D2 family protein/uncharacterized repeat protein (TIGR01451 family)/predicted ribosomally synthesized peptide with SipW-like signal peptide